jgi:hypothetical protein
VSNTEYFLEKQSDEELYQLYDLTAMAMSMKNDGDDLSPLFTQQLAIVREMNRRGLHTHRSNIGLGILWAYRLTTVGTIALLVLWWWLG